MQIDSIELFRVPLSATRPESGVPRQSIFVRLQSGEHLGFGEVSLPTGPIESTEWSAGAFACLRDWLAPALVGKSIGTGAGLQELLDPFQGNQAAKSALDIAWWNLSAGVRKKPLHELLGAVRTAIPLTATIGVRPSADELFAEIRAALEEGYQLLTLKFRPGWDVEMLRAVRQAFPSEPIAIDCDGCSSLGQQEMFYRLEDFFLKYIEQPLPADDLVGHAMLQEGLRTPIVLDQSIASLARVEQAIDLGSCKMARIDLARVGGITPALAIRKACREASIPCGVGGGPHSEVAASATAALAVACDLPLPVDSYRWEKMPWLMSDSTTLVECGAAGKAEIRLPADTPNWGFLLDTEMRADAVVERATLR